MALKEYEYEGKTYLFEDQDVPKGATEVKQKLAPANKARTKTDAK